MRDLIRLGMLGGVFLVAMLGLALGGYVGAGVGLVVGVLLFAVPWRGLQLSSWFDLYLRRNRPLTLTDPVTVANDRTGGGVRYQDGVAVAAVQVLGRPFRPTLFTGSAMAETDNVLDVIELLPMMKQSLGLSLESMSVVSVGARRRPIGDYPRVYDTLIGTPPYAGQRETWLVLRISSMENADALRWRTTVGAATLAAAQRIAMFLRSRDIRARVATATDISELDRRLGCNALEPHNRRWNSVRSDAGWQTTYAYRPSDVSTDALAQAWSLRVDGIIQNLTVLADGTASATVTIRTAQPPTAPPAVALQALPGEQATSHFANLCAPRRILRQVGSGPLPRSLVVPLGSSGILIGKTTSGDRMALPLADQCEQSRIHIAAEDAIVKRLIIRTAAAGERITVHTTNLQRWDTVRMPNIAVIEHGRPVSGTTVSVVDGTVLPVPRPQTVFSVGGPGSGLHPPADVVISQRGPETVEVSAAGRTYEVAVEFFRAENLYASKDPSRFGSVLEMAD